MSAYKYKYAYLLDLINAYGYFPIHIRKRVSPRISIQKEFMLRNEENKDDDHVIHQTRIFF